LHRWWRLGCSVGRYVPPKSQTSHCIIINGIIVKKLNLRRSIQEKLRYCFLNIVYTKCILGEVSVGLTSFHVNTLPRHCSPSRKTSVNVTCGMNFGTLITSRTWSLALPNSDPAGFPLIASERYKLDEPRSAEDGGWETGRKLNYFRWFDVTFGRWRLVLSPWLKMCFPLAALGHFTRKVVRIICEKYNILNNCPVRSTSISINLVGD
jgi:hypothetical protein